MRRAAVLLVFAGLLVPVSTASAVRIAHYQGYIEGQQGTMNADVRIKHGVAKRVLSWGIADVPSNEAGCPTTTLTVLENRNVVEDLTFGYHVFPPDDADPYDYINLSGGFRRRNTQLVGGFQRTYATGGTSCTYSGHYDAHPVH